MSRVGLLTSAFSIVVGMPATPAELALRCEVVDQVLRQ